MFTVHGLDEAGLERVREGLDHASGYFRRAISRRLRMKVAPAVTFAVDQVFEQAARVEKLLAETVPRPTPSTETAGEGDNDGSEAGGGADGGDRGESEDE
jgi:ribosome-binding factor A